MMSMALLFSMSLRPRTLSGVMESTVSEKHPTLSETSRGKWFIFISCFTMIIPPSRASFDLHSTGRNSTCSVVRSEKCFSSIFLAASLILRTSRDKTRITLTAFSLLCGPTETSPYLTCWCSWWCGPGPSSGQCRALQRRCVWFQVGCPQVLPPPRIPGGVVSHCWRLRTWEGRPEFGFSEPSHFLKPLYITKQTMLHVHIWPCDLAMGHADHMAQNNPLEIEVWWFWECTVDITVNRMDLSKSVLWCTNCIDYLAMRSR